jgi:hypothetical protein
MIYATTILFAIAIIIQIYIGTLHYRLNQQNIINTNRKPSLKILNEAIKNTNNKQNLTQLIYCKKVYIISLILFYSSILLIIFSIWNSSVK